MKAMLSALLETADDITNGDHESLRHSGEGVLHDDFAGDEWVLNDQEIEVYPDGRAYVPDPNEDDGSLCLYFYMRRPITLVDITGR